MSVQKLSIVLLLGLAGPILSQWVSCGPPPVGRAQSSRPLPSPYNAKPVQPVPEKAQVKEQNYGIDRPKMGVIEKYTYNGLDCSKEMAFQALGDPGIPNDSKMPWLVTVSKDRESKAKAKAITSSLANRFRIQNYLEDDWQTKNDKTGVTVFKPGLTVCMADGKQIAFYDTPEESLKELSLLPEGFDPMKLLDLLMSIRRPIVPVPPIPTPFPTLPNKIDLPPWLLWSILAAILFLIQRRSKP